MFISFYYINLIGEAFFENSREYISELAKDVNNKEKQILVSRYLGGLCKSLGLFVSEEKRRLEIIDSYIIPISIPCMESTSLELFIEWVYVLYEVSHSRGEGHIRYFLETLLKKFGKESSKKNRFISISKFVSKRYSYKAIENCQDALISLVVHY